MTKDEIMALTLSDLTLTAQARKTLIQCYVWQEIAEDSQKTRMQRHQLAKSTTVGQMIEAMDREQEENLRRNSLCPDDSARKQFKSELVKRGLTRLDWIQLPQASLTLKCMQSVSREDWLTKPVILLGTIPERIISDITRVIVDDYKSSRVRPTLTIQELLECPKKYCHSHISELQVAKTRLILRQLGFTYEDGWFMQFGSKRELLNNWMNQHSITKKEAEMVFVIARKEGWVSKPID